MSVTLQPHALGVTWIEDGRVGRTAHALSSDGQVWLIVAEAVGTAPAFALGRRAGVHPMLRLAPPRSQLSGYRPAMLLVGHGRTITSDAPPALEDALAHARSDIPQLLIRFPRLLRGG